jgi:tRNA(Arg) A34 adenosine deaminase TadA
MSNEQKQALIEKYMRVAFEEAEKAKEKGENPFGAVLLDSEYKFCHKAHTRSIELADPTAHAEVLVISEYCRKSKMVYLKDYILISSAEPCVMCSGAIKWAKIGEIYFSVPQSELNKKSGGKQKPTCESIVNTGFSQKNVIGNILLEDGLKLINEFNFTPQDIRQ